MSLFFSVSSASADRRLCYTSLKVPDITFDLLFETLQEPQKLLESGQTEFPILPFFSSPIPPFPSFLSGPLSFPTFLVVPFF